MTADGPILEGWHIRLEPLMHRHVAGLTAASAGEAELYRWSPVPQGEGEVAKYVDTALEWNAADFALAFAIVRLSDSTVIGSSRFFAIERWPWPEGHQFHDRPTPDACEIGYTWLTRSAIRTVANTESKLLMLSHAFDTWQVHRVCFHADVRNARSRAALERIGGKFEGILRAHRMAVDFIPRDSARFSITAAEWPEVKQRLTEMRARGVR